MEPPRKNVRSSCSSSSEVSQLQYFSNNCSIRLESICVYFLQALTHCIARPKQIHFHLTHVDFHNVADFLVAVTLDIAQVHHLTLFLGKFCHKVTDPLHILSKLCVIVR